MFDKLKSFLIKHEGLRLFPYLDTAEKITIGVGRNLSDVGISEVEAMFLFENDLKRAEETVRIICREYGIEFDDLEENVKIVLVDMTFNLGYRLRSFRKMFAAIKARDFKRARMEMLDSKWARQVGQRAKELSEMMYDE